MPRAQVSYLVLILLYSHFFTEPNAKEKAANAGTSLPLRIKPNTTQRTIEINIPYITMARPLHLLQPLSPNVLTQVKMLSSEEILIPSSSLVHAGLLNTRALAITLFFKCAA